MTRDISENSPNSTPPMPRRTRTYQSGVVSGGETHSMGAESVRSDSSLQAKRYSTVGHPVRSEGSQGLMPIESPGLLASGGFLALLGLRHWRSFFGLGLAGVGGGLIYSGLKKNRVFDPDFRQRLLNTMATEGTDVTASITIDRPVEQVYAAWRDLSNLAKCMKHIDAVRRIDQTHWHWIARAPKGDMTMQWDAEIVEEVENELLVWRSVQGSEINNEGMVEFNAMPGGQRTVIHAKIVYFPPAGKVGKSLAGFLKGLSAKFVKEDLRNFKQYMETGEVSTIEGQPSGRKPAPIPSQSSPDNPHNPLR